MKIVLDIEPVFKNGTKHVVCSKGLTGKACLTGKESDFAFCMFKDIEYDLHCLYNVYIKMEKHEDKTTGERWEDSPDCPIQKALNTEGGNQ